MFAFSTAFLEGRARQARRVFSRARVSESRATDELGEPELEGSLPGRGDLEVLLSSVLEICFVDIGPRRAYCDRLDLTFFSPRLDLSALLMLPLFPDCLALRAAIGLIGLLGLALLGGCLPLPLSLRGTTTGAFSGYRAVLGTGSLHIPVIYWCFMTRHVFCVRRWNGMKVVGVYEFGRVL